MRMHEITDLHILIKEIPCNEVTFVTIASLLFDSIAAFLDNIHIVLK